MRRPLVAALALITLTVLAADQATKAWALATLTEGERTPVLGDLLGLDLLHNPGAALGIATGMTWVFVLAAVGVTVVVVRVAGRLGSWGWTVTLGLLLGGALGNLVDRLTRPPGFGRGHVVDFIAYGDLFVGNVADIAIVVAAGLVMILSLRGIGLDGSRAGEAEPADDSAETDPAETDPAEGLGERLDVPGPDGPGDGAPRQDASDDVGAAGSAGRRGAAASEDR